MLFIIHTVIHYELGCNWMKDEQKNVSMEIKSHNAFLLAVNMLSTCHVQYHAFDKRKGLEVIDRIMSFSKTQKCNIAVLSIQTYYFKCI